MPHRTLAARRTDPQPLFRGSGRRVPDGALLPRAVGSASCAASVRSPALPVRVARALGRWRCRWSTPLLLVARLRAGAGIGRRASRFRPSPAAWSSCALLGRARRARGCVTPGDDRLETRAYAVKRYLFRLGHAARSARFACSIEQLVMGLAPVMGWDTPRRGGSERARFVRAHRKSVQRWLDDLQAAGLVDHEPERDDGGCWWRTQIVLLAAPTPDSAELAGRAAAGARLESPRARATTPCGTRPLARRDPPTVGRAWSERPSSCSLEPVFTRCERRGGAPRSSTRSRWPTRRMTSVDF